MMKLLRTGLCALLLTTAGCEWVEPSPQSESLKTEVVPQLEHWSDSKTSTLRLSDIPGLRGYEAICLVAEYNCVSRGEHSPELNIEEFHSSFGKCVPENRVAFIGVAKNVGHGVLLDRRGAFSNAHVFFGGSCASMATGVLRLHPHDRYSSMPILKIEEQPAAKSWP